MSEYSTTVKMTLRTAGDGYPLKETVAQMLESRKKDLYTQIPTCLLGGHTKLK